MEEELNLDPSRVMTINIPMLLELFLVGTETDFYVEEGVPEGGEVVGVFIEDDSLKIVFRDQVPHSTIQLVILNPEHNDKPI